MAESSCEVYEDDRANPRALAEGRYSLLTVKATDTPSAYTLTAGQRAENAYPGQPAKRRLTFRLRGVDAPGAITLSAPGAKSRAIKGRYDEATRTLTIDLPASRLPLTLTVEK